MSEERRKYRRIQAPVYCRPAGVKILENHEPIDLSLGGVRIFSDQPFARGESLKLEFFLTDTDPVTFTAEVVWTKALPAGSPAKYDVGLKFMQLNPSALKLLMRVLGPPEESDSPDGS